MSRIFEALQQSNPQMVSPHFTAETEVPGIGLLAAVTGEYANLEDVATFRIPVSSEGRLVAFTDPHSLAANKLKTLAARLRQTQQLRGIKKILITSAARGDGKTTTSANLAITFAAQGEKTLLIDGDLHQPALHKVLQVHNETGFSDLGEGQPVNSVLHRESELPLWFLPAGTCHHPLMKIQSSATPELLRQMSTFFSWIIIDSPPLVPLADAGVWNTMADGVLLLVRQGITPKKVLVKSLESFDKSKLLGLILNDATSSEEKYYRDYYSGTPGGSNKSAISSRS